MTSEQLEVARAERMRQNGNGTLTLEDARTWLEETGLSLYLPKRQFTSALAPSFVEAVAGQRNLTPDPRQIAIAEELLVRLETEGIAVRLNLLGQPGEQPDYVVAAWVLPYVYALRGDRDWRRIPQLTGSRQVSPLAVQAYKRLEANGDSTIAELKQALGHGVSEMAVLRAITELWQQLRIIPVVSAPGKPAKWQLLRHRFQKAIAEGASTSQVTAISVLASIFLQAVIAASMEEVEIFLSPLTARSKVREVLRGLVATRQVHTLSMGHAPHFYVAGTLPEFTVTPTVYGSSVGFSYLAPLHEQDEVLPEPVSSASGSSSEPVSHHGLVAHRPTSKSKNAPARKHFMRPGSHARDRKPGGGSARHGSDARPARTGGSSTTGSRWKSGSSKTAGASRSGAGAKKSHAGERNANGVRGAKSGSAVWNKHPGKNGSGSRAASLNHGAATARKETRSGAKSAHGKRTPAMAGRTSGGAKRPGLAKQGTKKH
ncbi:MAG TPA: hypothetical protein VKB38_08845 [Terracidiphilus sp.]|nr:hypothetical protein [Bryobacteraceae bacterium]HKF47451.1 hypothetical protein [Terracidiphilus sp.]